MKKRAIIPLQLSTRSSRSAVVVLYSHRDQPLTELIHMERNVFVDRTTPLHVTFLALLEGGAFHLALEPRLLLPMNTSLDGNINTAPVAANKLPAILHIKVITVWDVQRVL